MITPLVLYVLTACSPFRDYNSATNNNSIFGTLTASHPFDMECDPTNGLRLKKVEKKNSNNYNDRSNQNSNNKTQRLESRFPLSTLQRNLLQDENSNGVTISVWFRVTSNATWLSDDYDDSSSEELTMMLRPRPIVTIGQSKAQSEQVGYSYPYYGCQGYSFQLSLYYNQMVVSYTDNDPMLSCRYLLIRQVPIPPDVLNHVAVGFNRQTNTTTVSINGKLVVDNAPNDMNNQLTHWDPDSTLQLFSDHQWSTQFDGHIHQVEVYGDYLKETDVTELVERGMFNSTFGGTLSPSLNLALLPRNYVEGMFNVTIRQDSVTPIRIEFKSGNVTSPLLPLAIEIMTLPKYGNLFLPKTSNTTARNVVVHQRIPIPQGKNGITLQYNLTSATYFNVPSFDAFGRDLKLPEETIQYRLVALNMNKTRIVSTSEIGFIPINVVHVNHPLQLTVPKEAYIDELNPSIAYVTGIEVWDPLDYGIDRVRVDIRSDSGTLTLHPAAIVYTDYTKCSQRSYSAWQCAGSGTKDRVMIFIAGTNDLPFILRHLMYEGYQPGRTDTITIRIYDGVGDQCLDVKEHSLVNNTSSNQIRTIHDECRVSEGVIVVPEYDYEEAKKEAKTIENSGINGSVKYADLLFWGLVVLVSLLVCCCCRSCIYRCMARGGKLSVSDEENQQSMKNNI